MTSIFDVFRRLEEQFSFESATAMMNRNWHLSIYLSVFYVITIFTIQRYMRDREKYDLRRPLFLWSLLLSIFSAYGFWMCGITLINTLFNKGWKSSVCDDYLVTGRYGLWSFLFCFSKAPELVDTYFIVLRKQKLIFLHWYHHITVFIYCWYHYGNIIAPAQWFISMNYFVHSIMYFYYAVRASGIFRPPMVVNIFITSLQLLQMVVGVFVNLYIYQNMSSDPQWQCDGRVEKTFFYVYVAFAMYFSYFVLFANFFYTTYMNKGLSPTSRQSRSTDTIKKTTKSTGSPQDHIVQDHWEKYKMPSYYEGENGEVNQRLVYKNKSSSLANTHGLINIGMVRH